MRIAFSLIIVRIKQNKRFEPSWVVCRNVAGLRPRRSKGLSPCSCCRKLCKFNDKSGINLDKLKILSITGRDERIVDFIKFGW